MVKFVLLVPLHVRSHVTIMSVYLVVSINIAHVALITFGMAHFAVCKLHEKMNF